MNVGIRQSLYVGNLGPDVDEKELREHFTDIDPNVTAYISRDHLTRKSRLYGYVNFSDAACTARALDEKNITMLKNNCIRVSVIERDVMKRRAGQHNVVVKRIPTSLPVSEFRDLFKKFGRIVSLRLAPGEDGVNNRGYGYVSFESKEAVDKAIEEMNNSEIGGEGHTITCEEYNPNYREEQKKNYANVFIKNLNSKVEDQYLEEYFSRFGPITSKLVRRNDSGEGLGFAYVAFENHDSAAKAVEETNSKVIESLSDGEKELIVDRFKSRSERERERDQKKRERQIEYAKYPNMYVKNFDETITSDKLKELFSNYGETMSVRVMVDRETQRSRGFGFVSVKDRETMERCIRELHGSTFLGPNTLYVNAALRKDQRLNEVSLRIMEKQNKAYGPRSNNTYINQFGSNGPVQRGFGGMNPSMNPNMNSNMNPSMNVNMNPSMNPSMNVNMNSNINPHMNSSMNVNLNPNMNPNVNSVINYPAVQQRLPQYPQGPMMQQVMGNMQPRQPYISNMPQAQVMAQRPMLQHPSQMHPIRSHEIPLANAMDNMTSEQQKQAVGERLYHEINKLQTNGQAAKITGMFLEQDIQENVNLLQNRDSLVERVREAMDVLRQHENEHVNAMGGKN